MLHGVGLRRNRVLAVLAVVPAALVVVAGAHAVGGRAAATLSVCPTNATYTSIQAAVNDAAKGDRIEVCAASFSEQVVIDKSLTLAGAGQGQTRIVAPSPLTGSQDIVTITGGGVSVDLGGFTISGPGPTNDCSGLLSGVFVRDGAEAAIHDDTFTAIRNNPLDGCQKGVGIRVGREALSTSGTATITDNTFSDYQKGGIVVDGAGSSATITHNTITGAGTTDAVAQNGIQISRNADATVSENTISGNSYAEGGAAGILLYGGLGTVSISGNTLRDNDYGIDAASVTPKGKVTISGNTVSGGDRGITLGGPLGGTVETLVEKNTVSGAGTFGIHAANNATGNTFIGNDASGTSGTNHFDCRDESSGDKTAKTANTWTDDTGDTSSPEAICTVAPPKPPEPTPGPTPPGQIEVDPPEVIVLPPIPDTPAASEEPLPVTPEQPTPAPPAQPGAPQPPAPAPPAPPAPPAQPAAPLQPAPAPVQPPQPKGTLATATADEVITTMNVAKLSDCLITVSSHGPNQVVVARGLAHAPPGGSGVIVVRVGVQPKGQQLLAAHVGGVTVDVRAACHTTTNAMRKKTKLTRAVLRLEHVVTTPASWVPDRATLTTTGKHFLAQLRARMVAIKQIRCDGYTADYPPSPVDAHTLSAERARVVCSELKRTGITVEPHLVGHGDADPLASNTTEAGRAANRRVAITFVHLVGQRTSGV